MPASSPPPPQGWAIMPHPSPVSTRALVRRIREEALQTGLEIPSDTAYRDGGGEAVEIRMENFESNSTVGLGAKRADNRDPYDRDGATYHRRCLARGLREATQVSKPVVKTGGQVASSRAQAFREVLDLFYTNPDAIV
ncbi:hypothetical protein EJ08DRAFT_682538 [Tothia fuscella]|uniref:Uncharacterized protein n=1 Tax=Tothia fuscella TaxID=1048955 RepID=A0A9P4NIF9_9PEZI|nr:hypothetical protein EJ08DRAFT_682538 [Tothia fuscella]